MNTLIIACFAILLTLSISSCSDDRLDSSPNAKISFSVDTVSFDTVFTEVGTVTKRIKIYNQNKQDIEIEYLGLKEGSTSNFRINLDGISGIEHKNIIIPSKDSLYVFIEATIDIQNSNLPMVIYDALVSNSNGNSYEVTLQAFGQDVHLYKSVIIQTETWKNDKPYLILNNAAVDTGHTLTIEAGTQVHFNANSSLIVWGKLQVNGTFEEPVVFQGDRKDRGNDVSAGRWGTIFIHPMSRGNELNYALIKNASAGLQVGQPGEEVEMAQIVLKNVFVQNSSFANLIAYGSEITAFNSIFADAQYHGLALLMGGKYNFYHCSVSTFGAYYLNAGIWDEYKRIGDGYSLALTNFYYPFWTLNDYFMVYKDTLIYPLQEANFYNSIFYGNHEEEFVVTDFDNSGVNFMLDHCVLSHVKDSIDTKYIANFQEVFFAPDSVFINYSRIKGDYNLALHALSPAINYGSAQTVASHPELEFDFEGKSRLADGKPDAGAFERYE